MWNLFFIALLQTLLSVWYLTLSPLAVTDKACFVLLELTKAPYDIPSQDSTLVSKFGFIISPKPGAYLSCFLVARKPP